MRARESLCVYVLFNFTIACQLFRVSVVCFFRALVYTVSSWMRVFLVFWHDWYKVTHTLVLRTHIRNALRLKSVERFLDEKSITFNTSHKHWQPTLRSGFIAHFRGNSNDARIAHWHLLTPLFYSRKLLLLPLLLIHESTVVRPVIRPLTPTSRQCGYENRFQYHIFSSLKFYDLVLILSLNEEIRPFLLSQSESIRFVVCVKCHRTSVCFRFAQAQGSISFPYIYKIRVPAAATAAPSPLALWKFDGLSKVKEKGNAVLLF